DVSQTGDWHASGRTRSPSSTRKPFQPSIAFATVGSSGPLPSAASAMIDQTHGGWIPPHEPSASWRARIHCSAVACALRRSAHGRRGGGRAGGGAPAARGPAPGGGGGGGDGGGGGATTARRPQQERAKTETRHCGGRRTSSGGIGGIFCHGHWPMRA